MMSSTFLSNTTHQAHLARRLAPALRAAGFSVASVPRLPRGDLAVSWRCGAVRQSLSVTALGPKLFIRRGATTAVVIPDHTDAWGDTDDVCRGSVPHLIALRNVWAANLEKAMCIVANIVYVVSDAALRRRALVGPRLVVQTNLSRPTFKPKRVYVPPTGSSSAPDPWLMDIVAMRDRHCFQTFLMSELRHAEWVALWRGKDIRILALPHRGGRGGDPLTHATVRFGKKGVWHLYFEQAPRTKFGIRLVRGTCLHPKASIGC